MVMWRCLFRDKANNVTGGAHMGTYKKFWILMFIIPIIACGFLFTGCDDDDDDDNDTPTMAQITIRSDPDPIPYSGEDGGYHIWSFTFYVEETAGIGATVTEWRYDMYDVNNQLLSSKTHTVQEFSDWFTDCDATGAYINPNGQRCTSFRFRSTQNELGWSAVERLRFTDDNGNDFWAGYRNRYIGNHNDIRDKLLFPGHLYIQQPDRRWARAGGHSAQNPHIWGKKSPFAAYRK